MDKVAKKSGINMSWFRIISVCTIALASFGIFLYVLIDSARVIKVSVVLFIFVIICTIICGMFAILFGFGGTYGYYNKRKKNADKYLKKHKTEFLSKYPGWNMSWEFKVLSQTTRVTVSTRSGTRTENRTTYWLQGTVTFSYGVDLNPPL